MKPEIQDFLNTRILSEHGAVTAIDLASHFTNEDSAQDLSEFAEKHKDDCVPTFYVSGYTEPKQDSEDQISQSQIFCVKLASEQNPKDASISNPQSVIYAIKYKNQEKTDSSDYFKPNVSDMFGFGKIETSLKNIIRTEGIKRDKSRNKLFKYIVKDEELSSMLSEEEYGEKENQKETKVVVKQTEEHSSFKDSVQNNTTKKSPTLKKAVNISKRNTASTITMKDKIIPNTISKPNAKNFFAKSNKVQVSKNDIKNTIIDAEIKKEVVENDSDNQELKIKQEESDFKPNKKPKRGFDEFMNIVIDGAEEVYKKKDTRKQI
ncbi:hypothetical protein BB560_001957, partial [Smittium megazygosporum]